MGVHVKTPLLELMAAPEGAPGSSVKVSAWPEFGSVAEAVKVTRALSLPDLFPMAARTGGELLAVPMVLAARGVGAVMK